ncbi:hypothetical protein PC117_g6951 [Phytophthora cactorum]|uniref:Uncharacterized protein n=1 Tax=Phytophthora cactorum TaxID=29920 RepID=A0A8T1E1Q1_9STRA|nr:hypothetical protein PC117_g6951 [Phytophthora cactorum]
MAEMFPVTDHYLHPDAEIVHSPVFESAVVKVSRGTEADLTPQESQALEPFQLEAAATEPAASSRAGHDATPCISATDELRDVVFLRANLSMVQLKDNTIDNTFLYCNVRALLATQTSNRNRSNRLVTVVSSKICLWERLLEQLLHVLKSQHE